MLTDAELVEVRCKIPPPRGWNRRIVAAILHILSLSHYTFTALLGHAGNDRSRRTRLRAQIERLDHERALLREELRIQDARMQRVPPHRRPHYTPLASLVGRSQDFHLLELRTLSG